MIAASGGKWRQVAASGGKWRQVAASGSWWRGLVAVMAMMFVANTATAQVNTLPWENLTEPAEYAYIGLTESNWTLYPVVTVSDDFIGFFGYLPDEFVVGNNVSLLWLIPDNGDGTWSMYGWSNTDIKVVSDYLDNLTGTQNVLADTGLDIFTGVSGPIVAPKSMPNGIVVGDPAAPIVAATHDPLIAGALISVGAGGAPNLTQAVNLQPVDCPPAVNNDDGHITQLDMSLASHARTIQEMMTVWLSDGILDSLAATGFDQDIETLRTCWPCVPTVGFACNAWSGWSCTAGPVMISGDCTYTGCTRSRTCIVTVTDIVCNVTTVTLNFAQGPMFQSTPPFPGGGCPPNP